MNYCIITHSIMNVNLTIVGCDLQHYINSCPPATYATYDSMATLSFIADT